jgi:hypothetical protein
MPERRKSTDLDPLFRHCCVEIKRGRIRRMRHCQTTLAILAALSASIALADDFKTIDGKEYKNVTVSRLEPDGVVIKFSGGIVKIPFTELSKELQEKYHYDPGAAQKFAIQTVEEIKAANANAEELRKKGCCRTRSAIRSIGR